MAIQATQRRQTKTAIAAAALAAAAGLAAPGAAMGQDYPERPVEFIVPWSPGGGSDALMRVVANHVEPHLGQPMPVINIPGVGGTTGLVEASERDPDGYTVSQVHEGLPIANQTGLTDINWDDFEPIAVMTSTPQYVVVSADSQWETFEDLIEYARENPGDLRVGVTLGGVSHMRGVIIEDAADAEFSYVGYEGTGEQIRALVGGNLEVGIGDIPATFEFVQNGDLRYLAMGGDERFEETPDVPTFDELGYDLPLMTTTRGLVAPPGTPEERIAVLEEALADVSEDPEFRAAIAALGTQVAFGDSEAYRAYLEDLDATVGDLVGRLEN